MFGSRWLCHLSCLHPYLSRHCLAVLPLKLCSSSSIFDTSDHLSTRLFMMISRSRLSSYIPRLITSGDHGYFSINSLAAEDFFIFSISWRIKYYTDKSLNMLSLCFTWFSHCHVIFYWISRHFAEITKEFIVIHRLIVVHIDETKAHLNLIVSESLVQFQDDSLELLYGDVTISVDVVGLENLTEFNVVLMHFLGKLCEGIDDFHLSISLHVGCWFRNLPLGIHAILSLRSIVGSHGDIVLLHGFL